MTAIAARLLALVVLFVAYTYVGYPLVLKVIGFFRSTHAFGNVSRPWPAVSITVPVHNEAATIAATLTRILEIDYPIERRQILVVSDASTDGTDDIVRTFADLGVELLRMPVRRGKTAAENAALPLLRGEIIVNTDASIHIPANALRPLIAAFADPSVGVASGQDVSVTRLGDVNNQGESGYVGYEMWVREQESRVAGIVGASGCFYAIRADLHRNQVPEGLSRDFAAALVAREHGYRSVSVPAAICFVPRTATLRSEFRRKVRTMTRGMQTLLYKRQLLNPVRFGWFAWMLLSHKVFRWLTPWAAVLAGAALGVLSLSMPWVRWPLGGVALMVVAAGAGWVWPVSRAAPRLVTIPAYLVSGNAAALLASIGALRGQRHATWEPTRRDIVAAGQGQEETA
jgi:cellulose synthase/poly-beta-1,6-N-acetylglucosamine synthase-like glycosyltransferase